MAYLKTLTAAAFALAVPTAAALVTPGPAAATTGPTALASTTTTTVPTSDHTGTPDGSGAGVARHRASDTLTGHRTVLGELDSTGRPPVRLGDLAEAGRDVRGGTSGGPAGGPGSVSAGPWCNVQCITKGVAYQHGSGVELVVETSVPAQIFMAVWLDDDGDYDADPGTHQSASSLGLVTEFSWVPEDLDPGVTYYALAAATDVYGNTSIGWGTFTVPA